MAKLQSEGALIFQAQRAAERLAERVKASQFKFSGSVVTLSADEVREIAAQMLAVATIAGRYHVAHAEAGALAPEAFEGPVE